MALWRYAGGRGWDRPMTREVLAATPRDPLLEQMRHFLRVVRREEPPLVSGRDARGEAPGRDGRSRPPRRALEPAV